MDLLNNLRETALDPSYVAAAREHGGGRHRRRVLVPALVVVGLLFGIALANQWRTAPAAAQERAELIARITETEAGIDALRARGLDLNREIRELDRTAGTLSVAEQELSATLGVLAGADPVTGPGIRLTLDDGTNGAVQGSEVVDADLRMVVNGLWGEGAEAIAINGHRLSSRTAIRNAGSAITVDYRSISRPYVVEAIGDARALEEGFRRSEGGAWVEGLAEHYGVQWGMGRVNMIALPADPGLGVNLAHRQR